MDPMTLSAVASGATSGMQMIGNAVSNWQNRRFSRNMYELQRRDNLDFWNKQNAYNSPQEQMKRLQEAGLNPALMYGKAASAGQASPISTPDIKPVSFRPIFDQGAANSINQYFDSRVRQAQVDNLEVQRTLTQQDVVLRAAQIADKLEETRGRKLSFEDKDFDLKFKRDLRQVNADMLRESVRQKQAQIDNVMRQSERIGLLMAKDTFEIKKVAAEIIRTRAQTRLTNQQVNKLVVDTDIQKVILGLRRAGINPNDPTWVRVLFQNIISKLDEFGFSKSFEFSNPLKEGSVKEGYEKGRAIIKGFRKQFWGW